MTYTREHMERFAVNHPDDVGYEIHAAMIRQLLAESEWHPIETAPRDGTVIMLYGNGVVYLGLWNGRSWDDGDFHDDLGVITHWRARPEGPK